MDSRTTDLRDLVRAAQAGDAAAWTELVLRFQDFAVAVAIGHGADWDAARDVAQEAFLLAFTKLEELRDPEAFPGWFAAIARTACGRSARRAGSAVERLVPGPTLEWLEPGRAMTAADDPLEVVVAMEQTVMVRRAVQALPTHERTVIALHFLADLEFAEIARFLGIGESAARKRAHSARQRLKELESMSIDRLTATRPSANAAFRDGVLLFMAIDRGDAAMVTSILSRSPGLREASEVWSWSEALDAGLGVAQRGTPLVRAVETGSLPVVDALLGAGAAVDGRCQCAGAETPLWTAAVTGQRALVERLLAAGADPNAPSFNNSTPLHAAGQRHPELLPALIAAGGDSHRRDGGGRTPQEWAQLRAAQASPAAEHGGLIITGIRTVDLFAPLAPGSRQFWPPALRVGQLVLPFGIADALEDTTLWWIGFQHGGHYSNGALEAESRELDVPAVVRLVDPRDGGDGFAAVLNDLAAEPGKKLVVIIDAAECRHEVTLALHQLSSDSGVVSTIVIEPVRDDVSVETGDRHCESAQVIPEGFDTLLCFDAALAEAGHFPAVDPLTSQTTVQLSERHARAINAARSVLTEGAPAAEGLRDELTQRLRLGEPFGSVPGELTPFTETLTRVEHLTLSAGRSPAVTRSRDGAHDGPNRQNSHGGLS